MTYRNVTARPLDVARGVPLAPGDAATVDDAHPAVAALIRAGALAPVPAARRRGSDGRFLRDPDPALEPERDAGTAPVTDDEGDLVDDAEETHDA